MLEYLRKPGAPVTVEQLDAFAKKHGVSLPATYRDFLLKHNGGVPEPSTFDIGDGIAEVDYFCGVDAGQERIELANLLAAYKGRLPRRMLPIAESMGGNLYCVSTRGADEGSVYFWDHESEDEEDPDDEDAISLIAISFNAWINSFTPDPKTGGPPEWVTIVDRNDAVGLAAWLDAGGKLDEHHDEYDAPLWHIIDNGNPALLALLDERGVDPWKIAETALASHEWATAETYLARLGDARPTISSSLFQAALNDGAPASLIALLLDLGCDPNERLQRGQPLFHATEFRKNPGVVRLLLDRGATPGVFGGPIARLPLANAICNGDLESAKLLLDAGETLDAVAPEKRSMSHDLVEAERKKAKPCQELIDMQQAIIEHNRPKPAEWYLDVVTDAKPIAAEVRAYAAQITRGRTPPSSPGEANPPSS